MPPITPAHRRGNDAYNAKCGTIQLRPIQDVCDDIKAAASAAGQSVQKYVLLAIRSRMRSDSFFPKSNNWPSDDAQKIHLKHCYIAQFADGSRQRFPGFTEQDCMAAISEYSIRHGDITWYDGVTDEFYESGLLAACYPDPQTITQIDLTADGSI